MPLCPETKPGHHLLPEDINAIHKQNDFLNYYCQKKLFFIIAQTNHDVGQPYVVLRVKVYSQVGSSTRSSSSGTFAPWSSWSHMRRTYNNGIVYVWHDDCHLSRYVFSYFQFVFVSGNLRRTWNLRYLGTIFFCLSPFFAVFTCPHWSPPVYVIVTPLDGSLGSDDTNILCAGKWITVVGSSTPTN